MAEILLAELSFGPEDVLRLTSQERTRLLNFLMRWRAIADLHACLDVAQRQSSDRISLIDLRVRALAAEARYDEALKLMDTRLRMKTSATALGLMADVHLARGDTEAAEAIGQALLDGGGTSYAGWCILAEAALARHDLAAAAAAGQQINALHLGGQRYLLVMMALYQARQDWVTASAYAVRLLKTAENPAQLPPSTLEALLAYFRASREATRVTEVSEALDARYAQELDEIKAMLSERRTPPMPKPDLPTGPVRAVKGAAAPVTDTSISVSEVERARILAAVSETFGFQQLLPGQMETMACVFRGDNVLTILPTGGGKSLCYQAPALVADSGLTVVISPLIALMKDQVDSLPDRLRPLATTVNSSLDGDELDLRLSRAAQGDYRLLYAAPERLRQPAFLHTLRIAGVTRLVVDEAHCVSIWGHDFRPDYLKLAEAWEALGEPPILALTATAPPRVRGDILQHLSPGRPMALVTGDTFRSNLRLEVYVAANQGEKTRRLVAFCQAAEGSGIVYADTRARCEELAALLRDQGMSAEHYHAGMDSRDEVQERFMDGRTRIIVATIAFGMGIDKPDIRFIVHFMPPRSLESYYQEAGRAGRDGQSARCLLMVSQGDRTLLTRRMESSLPTIEFLRQVYAVVQRQFGPTGVARIASGDLERALQAEETRIRVALSILEENELLKRGPDVPRNTLIRLRHHKGARTQSEAFAAFCSAARFVPNQWLQVDLVDLAQKTAIPVASVERQVLSWADEGLIQCRFSGRDMLLERTPAPDGAAQRIQLWLDRFATIQAQRIDEILAYARTGHCRHGHLNAYLGGRAIDRCAACDNCVVLAAAPQRDVQTEEELLLQILNCLAESGHGWGKWSLIWILRASDRAPERGQSLKTYGALRLRSRSEVEALVDRLVRHGLLSARTLDNGGVVLELAAPGLATLKNPALLQVHIPRLQPAAAGAQSPPGDDGLYERLRVWRRDEAKARGVPAYVILHDVHLQAIAAMKPTHPEALLTIEGVGARKMSAFGEAIIGIVRDHLDGTGDSQTPH